MANLFQVKRTTVSGRTPNTTNSGNSQYIDTGELALNLTDGKMFSSNGSVQFEVGANLTNLNVSANVNAANIHANGKIQISNDKALVFKTTGGSDVRLIVQNDDNLVLYSTNTTGGSRPVFAHYANNNTSEFDVLVPIKPSGGIHANGTLGTSGQVLKTSGTGVYWETVAGGGGSGTVTQINTGNGMSGGPITTSGTVSVLANTGIVANSTGVFIDTSYTSTLSVNSATNATNANNASFVGGNSALDLRTYSETKASSAYANAQSYADLVSGTAYTNAVTISSNATNLTTGTVPPARLPLANTTSNGVVLFVDSVSNTAIEIYAPTANSVKRAYDAAVSAYSNATAYSSNATHITSGTLDTARLPATANISTEINVGANINITTSSINVGNSTVNSVVNSTSATITTVNANTVLANTVNAASFNTTAFTANTTGIIPAANNTALGSSDKRWDVYGGVGNFGGSVTIDGNLTVSGNSFTITATSLSVTDHMIYMNQGILATITAISGNGTAVVFTANNNFANGWDVFVSGVTPSSFNGTYHNLTEANATHFVVANTNTDTYTSGGTARGKTDANPDIGFAAGYNDGSYYHTGFFRDATDGVFKVFDNYGPEPDESAFIDTSNATFRIANLQANGFLAAVVNATTSVNSAIISVGTAFVANATGAYHTGVVNATTVSTTGFSANTTRINLGVGVLANGSLGTAGQVLTTDGSNVYWSTASGGGGGGGGGNNTFSIVTDSFVGNGSNTQFTLSVTPAGAEYVTVIVGGVVQFKNAYSVASAVITLVEAPLSGAPIEVTTYGGTFSNTTFTTTVQPFSPFLLMGAQN